MARADFAVVYDDSVHWGETDMFGHINNVAYFRYIESARVKYMAEVLSVDFGPDSSDTCLLLDLQCRFISQLHFPSDIEIGVRTERMGSKSFDLYSELFRKGEDSPFAVSTAVLVWYDFTVQKTKPIPPEIRQKIIGLESVAPREE